MKRPWGWQILALLLVIVFVGGCAKKTLLNESRIPPEQAVKAEATPTVTISDNNIAKAQAQAKATAEAEAKQFAEQAERAATLKAQAQNEADVKQKAAALALEKLSELTDIKFDYDKFSLTDAARETLKKHAAWLSKNKGAKLVIEGHCDERGTAEYNLALGQRRAMSAAKFLTDSAIDEKAIQTLSYGNERPLDTGNTEEAWTKNRRAHFVISGTK